MAKKGFIHLFFTALIAALLSFFLLYFFSPSMSTQFLGVSFATRKGSANALVLSAVDSTVEHMKNSPEFTKEKIDQFVDLVNSPEMKQKAKARAKEGSDAVEEFLQTLMDRVK